MTDKVRFGDFCGIIASINDIMTEKLESRRQ